MARGQLDFGALAPTETIVGISDLGELAARLGSIVTFDRRGNVIFLEDFSSLAKTENFYASAGGSVGISNLYALHGDFSCKLVTGNVTNGYAIIIYSLAYPVLSKIGVEFSWNRLDGGNLKGVWLDISLYSGTHYYCASLKWDASTGTWQYLSAGELWVALSPSAPYSDNFTHFHHTKLVVDFINGKYARLLADDLVYDLSDIDVFEVEDDTAALLTFYIQTRTNKNASAEIYIDSIIVTQNEP